jgi:hypothetical protein
MINREEWAEDHGYMRYRCPRHGSFWSDSGAYCEQCGEPEDEENMDGEQLKLTGMNKSVLKHSAALAKAQQAAKSLAFASGHAITIDNVREYYDSQGWAWDLGNAAGSVLGPPDWRFEGFVNSRRPAAHARVIRRWRLCAR